MPGMTAIILRREIRVQPSDERIIISFLKTGSRADITTEYVIRLVGRKTAPLRVLLGNSALQVWLDKSDFDDGGQGAYYELSTHISEIRFLQPTGDFSVSNRLFYSKLNRYVKLITCSTF